MASTSSLGNASLANASWAQAFYTQFRASTHSLLDQIACVTTTEALQDALQLLARLSADLTRAVDSGLLPAHDQGVHKRRLEEVSAALEVRRRELTKSTSGGSKSEAGDKNKGMTFAFKRKTPVSAAASPTTRAAASTSTNKVETSLQVTTLEEERKSTHLTISSLHNTTYHYTSNTTDHKDTQISLDLTNLTSSLIDLRPLSSTHTILSVQLRSVSNSILLLPPIEGSMMIHDLNHSLLAIPSCHQFRMHTSHEVAVELCTKRNSVVTVEGCKRIMFVAKVEGEEEAGLRVQDFDDLINSDQLKADGAARVRGKEANFRLVKSKQKDLAERVEAWFKVEERGSTQACIDKFLSEIDGSA
ncbi:uncharacterized protein UTRI_00953 [Ustilago trichophora]|uniref:Tubulin binding cofactor C-like domain-containing protein n=1 Tax=Ustilago trichophora TaxID=86804 RepID=A0A5C3DVC8_9BASI|nr:uncharacterized protein UTRI_00953 [Ustilago trichophora]